MFKEFSLNRILVLATTIGFAILLIDTTIEHWEIFNKETMAYIPLVYSVFALILGAITIIKWKLKIIHIFRIYLVISVIVAASGLYFHLAEEEDEDNPRIEQQDYEKNESEKPLLAPLSFAGLAVFGLIGTSKKWQSESLEKLI